ncbi:MAG: hypothetical protein U0556_20070, partial [Dehalococcoidia bacterium]
GLWGRTRLVFAAAAHGSLAAFVMTHGLFLHLIPFLTPFLLLAAPIVGGMRARQRVRLGLTGSIVVALCIALSNVFPYLLVVPLVLANQHLFSDADTAQRVTAWVIGLVSGFVAYSLLGAFVGILFRHIRRPKSELSAALIWTRPLTISQVDALALADRRLEAEPSMLRSTARYTFETYPPNQN